MAQSPLIMAFAVPGNNLMVIDYSKMVVDPFSTEATLKHELCHLLLHSHIPEGRIPKWLDEGLAQWVSGGMAEIIPNRRNALLTEAVIADRLISLKSLVEAFPRERDDLLLAYEESKSVVSYTIGRYGVESVRRVLEALKQGYEWEEAVAAGLSISFAELEGDWRLDLKKRLTWFTYLTDHLYDILFFLAALLMIAAFARRVWQKRAGRHGEQDDLSSDTDDSET